MKNQYIDTEQQLRQQVNTLQESLDQHMALVNSLEKKNVDIQKKHQSQVDKYNKEIERRNKERKLELKS